MPKRAMEFGACGGLQKVKSLEGLLRWVAIRGADLTKVRMVTHKACRFYGAVARLSLYLVQGRAEIREPFNREEAI